MPSETREVASQAGVTLTEYVEVNRDGVVLKQKYIVRSPRSPRMPVYEDGGTSETALKAFNDEVARVLGNEL